MITRFNENRTSSTVIPIPPSVDSILKDFNRSQGAVRRGLIAGSLLIELHRQRSELIHSRNGRELRAIEALWLIHKFDGRIFTEKP